MGSRTHHESKDDIRALGERLAALRKDRGFTQVELAERLGVSQNAVSEYENGKSRLSATMLRKIADTIGVSSDEILGRKNFRAKEKIPRRIVRRAERIERLPRRQQQALLRTIDAVIKGSSA